MEHFSEHAFIDDSGDQNVVKPKKELKRVIELDDSTINNTIQRCKVSAIVIYNV